MLERASVFTQIFNKIFAINYSFAYMCMCCVQASNQSSHSEYNTITFLYSPGFTRRFKNASWWWRSGHKMEEKSKIISCILWTKPTQFDTICCSTATISLYATPIFFWRTASNQRLFFFSDSIHYFAGRHTHTGSLIKSAMIEKCNSIYDSSSATTARKTMLTFYGWRIQLIWLICCKLICNDL